MSTTPINRKVAEALQFETESFTQELKGYKWKITEANLGKCIVENKLHLAKIIALSQLCSEISGDESELALLSDKIVTSGKIIEGLCASSLADPRLWELPKRIGRLNDPQCPHKAKKLEKYGTYLNMIAQNDQIPFSKILPMQIGLKRASLELNNPYELPPVAHPSDTISPIFSLQSAINGLALNSNEGFGKALDRILWLDDLTFTTCADDQEQIANRIFFHLQSIQKNESPLKEGLDEAHYGANAFLSEETPNAQKLRAIQRTQIEVCLFALEKFLEGDQSLDSPVANLPALNGIFKILEDLELDPKDMPQGHKNIAHALFGTLYTHYLAAWENNQSMIHPHDGTFKSDFGRNAFIGDSQDRVPNAYKIQVINGLSASLWQAWNL